MGGDKDSVREEVILLQGVDDLECDDTEDGNDKSFPQVAAWSRWQVCYEVGWGVVWWRRTNTGLPDHVVCRRNFYTKQHATNGRTKDCRDTSSNRCREQQKECTHKHELSGWDMFALLASHSSYLQLSFVSVACLSSALSGGSKAASTFCVLEWQQRGQMDPAGVFVVAAYVLS